MTVRMINTTVQMFEIWFGDLFLNVSYAHSPMLHLINQNRVKRFKFLNLK